ncbi:MAG: DEAD/DEAH box helicase [Cryomorphaceae bacterium]|nr:DEAD/DEAH box helicase [Cryomorphaceae bacterium]
MTFKDLAIAAPILSALEKKGYTSPTPIQEQAIPILLAGKDLMGCAQTGTGKTAAFAIPIIQHLHNDPHRSKQKRVIKALVVTPTRELAIQIQENFTEYGAFANIRTAVVFGGVKQNAQVNTLQNGIDVLIATPGRLLDLMNQGYISLREVAYFVLDEADQMLDMGFINDIKKLLTKLPKQRQSLFFSATMPATIVKLSNEILGDYERVTIQPQQTTAERVGQGLFFVNKSDKQELLSHLIKTRKPSSVLVFTRTKHGADKVVKYLSSVHITAAAIHGNKSQNNRQVALSAFKDGKIKVLIATDIAARGIDVSELELVINYDLPNVPETYVHRIGRTGRASASGTSLSFCDGEEKPYLKDIEKLIQQKIPVLEHPFADAFVEKPAIPAKKTRHAPRKGEKPKNPKWRGGRRDSRK